MNKDNILFTLDSEVEVLFKKEFKIQIKEEIVDITFIIDSSILNNLNAVKSLGNKDPMKRLAAMQELAPQMIKSSSHELQPATLLKVFTQSYNHFKDELEEILRAKNNAASTASKAGHFAKSII